MAALSRSPVAKQAGASGCGYYTVHQLPPGRNLLCWSTTHMSTALTGCSLWIMQERARGSTGRRREEAATAPEDSPDRRRYVLRDAAAGL